MLIRAHSLTLPMLLTLAACGSDPLDPQGPATLNLRLTVGGLPTGTANQVITVSDTFGVSLSTVIVPYAGGNALTLTLAAGDYRLLLDYPAETCIPMHANPRVISLRAGESREVELIASCYGPPAQVFNRPAANRDYFDRLALEPDGRFLYQIYGRGSAHGLPGNVVTQDGRLMFRFDASPNQWEATGTLEGDCLRVDFNDVMDLSDFEDGTFCAGAPNSLDRSPAPR